MSVLVITGGGGRHYEDNGGFNGGNLASFHGESRFFCAYYETVMYGEKSKKTLKPLPSVPAYADMGTLLSAVLDATSYYVLSYHGGFPPVWITMNNTMVARFIVSNIGESVKIVLKEME